MTAPQTGHTPDPQRPRKLVTAAIVMALIAAFVFFLTSRHREEASAENRITPAASTAASSAASASSTDAPEASVSSPAVAAATVATDSATSATSKDEALKVRPDDIVWGQESAPVTIIEYASLSCSHCANFHTAVFPAIEEKYIATGKVRFVHRFFPLNEPALRASQIVSCAGKEKAHAFLKVLFATQEQWAFDPAYGESLARIAGVGGLSRDAFDRCLADKTTEEKALLSRKEGQEILGVDSTPTFFINGQKFDGDRTLGQFSTSIDSLL